MYEQQNIACECWYYMPRDGHGHGWSFRVLSYLMNVEEVSK